MSSREEFEAWVDSNFPFKKDRFDLFRGEYKSQFTKQLWQSWQAGREGLESRLKSAESNDIDARCHVAELEAKCAALAAELKQSQIDAACYKKGMEASNERLVQVAAENAGLKTKGRELLDEACKVYEKFNTTIKPETVDLMDGQTLHEFQFLLDADTPATDAFLAEVRASALPADVMAAIQKVARIRLDLNDFDGDKRGIADCLGEAEESMIEVVNKFAAQLRQEAAQ